ncbi:hypothetical protein [Caballeronia sordidicola]|uniref:Uncharacterized protein n=1 Tax=Caballeronia sordidicola TaxID=196367 RepID=A0A242MDT8_CABSO|nr:hypothetical protein [Caballeronia sordidicola]OTP69466.1 hypothetical protein PAMC26577_30975 [Caballeronia sordidicola]
MDLAECAGPSPSADAPEAAGRRAVCDERVRRAVVGRRVLTERCELAAR